MLCYCSNQKSKAAVFFFVFFFILLTQLLCFQRKWGETALVLCSLNFNILIFINCQMHRKICNYVLSTIIVKKKRGGPDYAESEMASNRVVSLSLLWKSIFVYKVRSNPLPHIMSQTGRVAGLAPGASYPIHGQWNSIIIHYIFCSNQNGKGRGGIEPSLWHSLFCVKENSFFQSRAEQYILWQMQTKCLSHKVNNTV